MNLNAAEAEYSEIPSIVDHLNILNDNVTDAHEIIQKELLLFGPVTITFMATEEFLHYSEGTVLVSWYFEFFYFVFLWKLYCDILQRFH